MLFSSHPVDTCTLHHAEEREFYILIFRCTGVRLSSNLVVAVTVFPFASRIISTWVSNNRVVKSIFPHEKAVRTTHQISGILPKAVLLLCCGEVRQVADVVTFPIARAFQIEAQSRRLRLRVCGTVVRSEMLGVAVREVLTCSCYFVHWKRSPDNQSYLIGSVKKSLIIGTSSLPPPVLHGTHRLENPSSRSLPNSAQLGSYDSWNRGLE